jgi:hypothetical protein
MEYIGFSSSGGGYELMDRIATSLENIAKELHELNKLEKSGVK